METNSFLTGSCSAPFRTGSSSRCASGAFAGGVSSPRRRRPVGRPGGLPARGRASAASGVAVHNALLNSKKFEKMLGQEQVSDGQLIAVTAIRVFSSPANPGPVARHRDGFRRAGRASVWMRQVCRSGDGAPVTPRSRHRAARHPHRPRAARRVTAVSGSASRGRRARERGSAPAWRGFERNHVAAGLLAGVCVRARWRRRRRWRCGVVRKEPSAGNRNYRKFPAVRPGRPAGFALGVGSRPRVT